MHTYSLIVTKLNGGSLTRSYGKSSTSSPCWPAHPVQVHRASLLRRRRRRRGVPSLLPPPRRRRRPWLPAVGLSLPGLSHPRACILHVRRLAGLCEKEESYPPEAGAISDQWISQPRDDSVPRAPLTCYWSLESPPGSSTGKGSGVTNQAPW